MLPTSARLTAPDRMRPGQRAMPGTRKPPSQVSPLKPRSKPLPELCSGAAGEVRFSERLKSPASGLQAADTHLWIAMHGRAIVTGEEHEGIVVGSTLLEGTHDLAHGPVNLFHSVADGASTRAAAKGRTACVGFVNVIERYLHMTKAR